MPKTPASFSRPTAALLSIPSRPCPSCALRTSIASFQTNRQRKYSAKQPNIPVSNSNSQRLSTRLSPVKASLQLCANSAFAKRHASSLASHTAVNATKDIPPAFKELHDALGRLKRDAPNYVELSRSDLAIRGLERRRPLLRLAVLGLQSQTTARQLARLLVADPLAAEGVWEGELDMWGGDEQRGLLLRYGEDVEKQPSNAIVNTLQIPSHTLHRYNLEILISVLNVTPGTLQLGPTQSPNDLKQQALVPMGETPNSFSGEAVSLIAYPVHRAIVVGDGLSGLLTLGHYDLSDSAGALKVALHLPTQDSSDEHDVPGITLVNIPQARNALAKFRESNDNASLYGQEWPASGMPALTSWISESFSNPTASQTAGPTVLPPALKDLIISVLNQTSITILREDEAHLRALTEAAQLTFPTEPAPTQSLTSTLDIWAMRAHEELQESLDVAFESRAWARLKWWKLPVRIDDIDMIASELVSRRWLVEAEKGVFWVAGRGVQAGLFFNDSSNPVSPEGTNPASSEGANFDVKPPPQSTTSTILAARTALTHRTIPPLHALAQALLLQTASTATLSAALAALLYLSLAPSLYTAGAVFALGAAFSLRRLQKRWEDARAAWRVEVTEVGRATVKAVEARLRTAVARGLSRNEEMDAWVGGEGDVGVVDRRAARGAVEGVWKALRDVEEAGRK